VGKPRDDVSLSACSQRPSCPASRHDKNDRTLTLAALQDPGDKARCLLEVLHDPARRVVRHSAPEANSAAAAAIAEAATFVTPLAAAMTVGGSKSITYWLCRAIIL